MLLVACESTTSSIPDIRSYRGKRAHLAIKCPRRFSDLKSLAIIPFWGQLFACWRKFFSLVAGS